MSLTAAQIAGLEADHSARVYFVFLDFAGDPFHANTSNRTIPWDGESWLAIGEIAGISDIGDANDLAARAITFTLSGVDAWITTPILNRQNYKGADVAVYRGLMDANEDLIATDPWLVWEGRMDVGTMTYAEGLASATLVCEPKAAQLLRANISRYSDEDHQLRHSGDLFFEYLPQMAARDANWGGRRVDPYNIPDYSGYAGLSRFRGF